MSKPSRPRSAPRTAPSSPVDTEGGPHRRVHPLVPLDTGTLELRDHTGRAAAGAGAVLSSLRYTFDKAPARGLRSLLTVNQRSGFDCPGCAWPDPDQRAAAEFCENGARAVADESTHRRVTREFFAEHDIHAIGTKPDRWINDRGRLTEPMYLAADASHYRPVPWSFAFDKIAEHLHRTDDPNEAVFYTSGRTSNEAAFLYQLFVRQFGTNNLPDCSNMCHESSGVALGESIGIGKGTVQLEDFEHADLILIFGQNPGTNHPRMLSTLREARLRGATIISINPLREQALVRFAHPQHVGDFLTNGVEIAHEHVQVTINGDHALLLGIQKALHELDAQSDTTLLDHEFIAAHTRGFETQRAAVLEQPWEQLERSSGVERATMRSLARRYAESRATIACWAMGLTQHRDGVATIQEVVNLLLLRGNLGRRGAGACPVRGHSNVQGDRTMGIWEYPPAWIEQLEQHFEFRAPREPGFDVVAAIKAMAAGKVRVFVGLGGNFLSASPDTELTARALQGCDLTVHVSTKLNRSHVVPGREALILPCLARTELDTHEAAQAQFVTVEDSMGVVHRSQGSLAPASDDLRSEIEIVAGMAKASLTGPSTVDWSALERDYDLVRDHIAAVVPGFRQYNERVRGERGFLLDNAPARRQWTTSSGKAEFRTNPLSTIELADGQLLMMTLRSHDQYNTTIYGDDDRYRGVHGFRRVLFMAESDMAARGLQTGDLVDIRSHHASRVRHAPRFTVVAYDLPTGCTASYFPEANVLVPIDSRAERSRTPTSKSIVIEVSPTSDPSA